MGRFYVPPENIAKDQIVIDGQEAHHIIDVMRMQDGDKVVVFDGTGNEYSGFIKFIDARTKKLIVQVIKVDVPSPESLPSVTLVQAIPEMNKMDHIVEKATELGVSKIIPVISERTIVRPDESSSAKKVERWRNISLESSKQCGRTEIPVVEDICRYGDVISCMDRYDLALFACLAEDTISIKESLSDFQHGKILVFVGPEGDFTPDERVSADKDNCRFISLGKRVLRSDTAGLFILSVLGYELGV